MNCTHIFKAKILSTNNGVIFTVFLSHCDNASKTFQREYPIEISEHQLLKRIISDSEINKWASDVTQEYMEATSW